MMFSLVIPAFNAAATLAETLDSVIAQTFSEWEVVVVDDGSSDDTAAIATVYAHREPRIRVVSQANEGMAAARNTGIGMARGTWMIFLDSDDLLTHDALEVLAKVAASRPDAGALVGGWARLAPGGELVADAFQPDLTDLFHVTARFSPFPIHACAVRRETVLALRGFRSSYHVFADWDFWQRLARRGTVMGETTRTIALYRMRMESAIMSTDRMIAEGLAIIATGHAPDLGVVDADPRYVHGASLSGHHQARIRFAVWPAAMLLGAGEDATRVLASLTPGDRDPTLTGVEVANSIFRAALLPKCLTPTDWPDLLGLVGCRVDAFLTALEQQVGAQGLAGDTRRELDLLILEAAPQRPLARGECYVIRVDVESVVDTVACPPGTRLMLIETVAGAERIGHACVAVSGQSVRGEDIADAIARQFGWSLLQRFFAQHVYGGLTRTRWGVLLGDACSDIPGDAVDVGSAAFHDTVGWSVLVQELWGWPAASPPPPFGWRGREIRLAWDVAHIEASGELPTIVSVRSIDVRWTIGGTSAGMTSVKPVMGSIAPQRLRDSLTGALGSDLVRLVVRGALVGRPLDDPTPIRSRLRQRCAAC